MSEPTPPGVSARSRHVEVLELLPRALRLVWATSPPLTVALAVLTVVGGLLPAGIALVGQKIVDGVLAAAETGLPADRAAALSWVAVEAGLVAALAGARRGLDVSQTCSGPATTPST